MPILNSTFCHYAAFMGIRPDRLSAVAGKGIKYAGCVSPIMFLSAESNNRQHWELRLSQSIC